MILIQRSGFGGSHRHTSVVASFFCRTWTNLFTVPGSESSPGRPSSTDMTRKIAPGGSRENALRDPVWAGQAGCLCAPQAQLRGSSRTFDVGFSRGSGRSAGARAAVSAHLCREQSWGVIPQRAVRPHQVVVLAPRFQFLAYICQPEEHLHAQTFIPQPAVKRFDIAVLNRSE